MTNLTLGGRLLDGYCYGVTNAPRTTTLCDALSNLCARVVRHL